MSKIILNSKDKIRTAILGLALGDIAGVPYEFKTAQQIEAEGGFRFMNKYLQKRTHDQPLDSWSDDTALTLAAMDGLSMIDEIPIDNIPTVKQFLSWYVTGEYMPYGHVFDIGTTTITSLRYLFNEAKRTDFWTVGHEDLNDSVFNRERWKSLDGDSNGALMRVLPHALFTAREDEIMTHDSFLLSLKEAVYLTHPSVECFLTTVLYQETLLALLEKNDLKEALKQGRERFAEIYEKNEKEYQEEYELMIAYRSFAKDPHAHTLKNLRVGMENLFHEPQRLLPEHSTFGSVMALRLALLALHDSSSFEETITKTVSYGGDTDTTSAIAGSLAGAFYGVPDSWLGQLSKLKLQYIENKIESFIETLIPIRSPLPWR